MAAALLLGLSSRALPAAPAPAVPVLSVSARPTGNRVVTDLALRWDHAEELIASLVGGLESRLVFTVRLYEKRSGLFALRGDRMVAQAVVIRTAHRDILTQAFVIDEEVSAPGAPGTNAPGAPAARRSCATTGELLAAFFSVQGLALDAPSRSHPSYVAARAQLEPVRLMPPLTLVILAGAAAYATPWVRSDAP